MILSREQVPYLLSYENNANEKFGYFTICFYFLEFTEKATYSLTKEERKEGCVILIIPIMESVTMALIIKNGLIPNAAENI